jgi:uncharacterized protein (TIGR03066 family)
MNALRLVAAGFVVVALTTNLQAEKKDNVKLLVGSWDVTKSFDKGPPIGAVLEFGKEGKVKATAKVEGTEAVHEGTYTVDGDKVTVVTKDGEKEHKRVVTIKKISDTELVIDHGEGKLVELKRKK